MLEQYHQWQEIALSMAYFLTRRQVDGNKGGFREGFRTSSSQSGCAISTCLLQVCASATVSIAALDNAHT